MLNETEQALQRLRRVEHEQNAIKTIAAVYEQDDDEGRSIRVADEFIDHRALAGWHIRAERALRDVFEANDPVLVSWGRLGPPFGWTIDVMQQGFGVLRAAVVEIEDGHVIEAISARVRAATERDLVDQARLLCGQGNDWAAAAALLAGAALELRLHDIAKRHGIALGSKPTMGSVKHALIGARTAVLKTVDPTDDTLLDRWLAMRNDAAHRTATFPYAAAQVEAELGPLEVFLAKTT